MTFEQKVEKLRGIVDKKIAIHTETKQEDIDFCNMINNCFKYSFEIEDCGEGYVYAFTFEDDFKDEVSVDVFVLEYSRNDYQIVPYSEFFADDKVEDKPLGKWMLGEVQEYCDKLDGCPSDCIFQDICCEAPTKWELGEDKPYLTQSEIEILKAIKVLYPNKDTLTFWRNEGCYGWNGIEETKDKLPSLDVSKEYNINELLKEV